MRRKLFNIAAGASLALFAASAALWVRGHWQCDQVNWFSEKYGVNLSSANSVFAVMFGPNYKGPNAMGPFQNGWRYKHYPAQNAGQEMVRCQIPIAKYRRWGWLGFAYDPNTLVTDNGPPKIVYYSSHRFYFPHWSVVVIAAILPVLWWFRWRRERAKNGRPLRGMRLRSPRHARPLSGTWGHAATA
jgi:hypothetical protein